MEGELVLLSLTWIRVFGYHRLVTFLEDHSTGLLSSALSLTPWHEYLIRVTTRLKVENGTPT
jgi:hypothetical protein